MAKVKAKVEYKDRLRKDISARVIAVRERLGLPQGEMAEALGISRTTLYRIEKGDLWPPPVFMRAMRETYYVSLDWFITGEGEMICDDLEIMDPVPGPITSSTLDERDKEDIDKLLDYFHKVPFVRHAVLSYFFDYILEYKDIVEFSLKEYERFTERKRTADEVA
ncbi:MAG: helix-turn-helix domain-containing protein [bacterium]|nr:helix-turn-helix domain-containing protein [bacterium]